MVGLPGSPGGWRVGPTPLSHGPPPFPMDHPPLPRLYPVVPEGLETREQFLPRVDDPAVDVLLDLRDPETRDRRELLREGVEPHEGVDLVPPSLGSPLRVSVGGLGTVTLFLERFWYGFRVVGSKETYPLFVGAGGRSPETEGLGPPTWCSR